MSCWTRSRPTGSRSRPSEPGRHGVRKGSPIPILTRLFALRPSRALFRTCRWQPALVLSSSLGSCGASSSPGWITPRPWDGWWKRCSSAAPICRYETTLINNLTQGLDLLERVGADNMGLMPDTFHMNIEEASIEGSIRACGDRIFHFHAADSNRWYPGAGHLDFGSMLESLFATGYEGYVSGEFMPMPDADTAAQKGIAFLRSVQGSWAGA
jgi:hypothetical protein